MLLPCPRTDRSISVLWKSLGDGRFLSRQVRGHGLRTVLIPDVARPGVLGARAARHRLGGSGFVDSLASFPSSQEDALADVRTRSGAGRRPRNGCDLYLTDAISNFAPFRLVACVCLTVGIGALYQ
jgi:hypothetical protein